MLPLIVKFIIGLIMSITAYFSIKNILSPSLNPKKEYVIASLILTSIPTIIIYNTEYSIILALVVYALMIIIFKYLFNIEISISILVCGYVMLLIALVDVTLTIVEIPIFSII